MSTEQVALATQFTQFYYATFDGDRAQLAPLYRPHSMLTWEGSPIQGGAAIIEKLSGLPFQKVVHKVNTCDVQPTSTDNLLISITGLLVIDDSENPLQFSQIFQIIKEGETYYVLNDIFRLVYGA